MRAVIEGQCSDGFVGDNVCNHADRQRCLDTGGSSVRNISSRDDP
jgi:hypothetical protein